MTSVSTATRPAGVAPPASGGRQRHSGRRRRRWTALLVAVLVVGVLAAGGWLVGFSPVFAAHRVTVSGTRILSADEVRQVAAVRAGQPLARQDVDAIARRLAALPPVESARVTREWPRTIAVRIVERVAVLAVTQPGGYLLVARSGVGFERVTSLPATVVPTTVDSGNPARLREAATVAAALPSPLRRQVRSMSADSIDSVRLVLTSGTPITWGTSDDSALKASITLALLKQKPRGIDVSAPHNPAVR